MRKPKAKGRATWKSDGKQKKLVSAYREAVKEIADERVNEIKSMVRLTLDAIRKKDDEIRRLTEERDDYKKDIEDLKRGKLDRIKARHAETAGRMTSPIDPEKIKGLLMNASYTSSALPIGGAWTYNTTDTNLLNNAVTSVTTSATH